MPTVESKDTLNFLNKGVNKRGSREFGPLSRKNVFLLQKLYEKNPGGGCRRVESQAG